MAEVAEQTERIGVAGELEEGLGIVGDNAPTAETLFEETARHSTRPQPVYAQQAGGHRPDVRDRVVVHPGDAVPGQQIEDRSVGWAVKSLADPVADEAVGRPGYEEVRVRKRRSQARGEPSVGQGKDPGKSVIKGQVLLGPKAHGRTGVGVGSLADSA